MSRRSAPVASPESKIVVQPKLRSAAAGIVAAVCAPLAVAAVWLLPWPYWPVIVVLLGVLVWVTRLASILVEEELERRRSHGLVDGFARLRGVRGVTVTDLAPTGVVKVDGEVWSARTDGDLRLVAGSPVVVVGAHDLVLLVAPSSAPAEDDRLGPEPSDRHASRPAAGPSSTT